MADENNEQSQVLDDDVVPEEFPPEQPYGVDERLTAAEEQVDEPLADRVKRERPDTLGADAGRVGVLVDEGGPDTEPDMVAEEIAPGIRRDQVDPGSPTLSEYMTQDKEEVISAEEAAMHLTDEPPMGDGDGYLEDE